ncbi:hypothetical protein Tco_0747533, partial [Tanacetum coccineum]
DAKRPGEDMCGSYRVMWRGYGMSKEGYGAKVEAMLMASYKGFEVFEAKSSPGDFIGLVYSDKAWAYAFHKVLGTSSLVIDASRSAGYAKYLISLLMVRQSYGCNDANDGDDDEREVPLLALIPLVGSGDEIGWNILSLEFSKELKEMLPAEAGK